MATNVPDVNNQKKRTITLTSTDNHEFVILETTAFLSETIKKMVEARPAVRVIRVPFASGTLAKVVKYLNKHVEGTSSSAAASDEEFVAGEEFDDHLDLSKAAYFLKVTGLMDIACKKVADMMMDKSVEWMRKAFGVENDYTPEEEEELRQKHGWAWADPKDD